MAPFLPLSQILMILRLYTDPTKKLFVMVQHLYDNEPVTFSYMEEFSPEIAAILPILLLLLEGKLKVDVNMYFRSLYTEGTEGYE